RFTSPRATRAATLRVYGPRPRHLVAHPDMAAGRGTSVTTSDAVTEVRRRKPASGGDGCGDYDRAVQVLSADWVLPIEGEPIEDGAVAIGDDGRIAAVGRAAELGAGRRFECAAIVPGFVNAHAHLEYAAYAGFGDGLEFAPW